jgi:hypothetical protein
MWTFFEETKVKAAPARLGPDCQTCGLFAKCKHPKQKPFSKSKTVIVVDSPEDRADGLITNPKLADRLAKHSVSLGRYTVVPAIACPGNGADNWQHCQPLLIDTLKQLQPENIILLGKAANRSVISHLWRHPPEMPDRWYGRRIPSRELNAWVFPVGRAGKVKNPRVAEIHYYRWLDYALKARSRPYEVVPDYVPMVQILTDVQQIIDALKRASMSMISAFDYETNSLKSTWPGAKIYSGSVAWLEGTKPHCVAFMFTSEIADAWKAYLQSDSYKIAANFKFEDRWSRYFYGVEVNRWIWDTMICAHIADPQPTVTGLKFQAFTELGQPFYAGEVERYFEESTPDGLNMIHRIDQRELLLYNGIDAIAELDLGLLQMYQAGRNKTIWSDSLPSRHHYVFGEIGC